MHRPVMHRWRSAHVLFAVATLLSWGRAARAQGEPPTAEEIEVTYPPPSARLGVTLGGVGAALAFYGGAVGLSYAFPDVPGAHDLRIPIAGPWIAIAHNGCLSTDTDCSHEFVAFRSAVEALDGIAQVGSLVIALEGLLMPTQEAASRTTTGPHTPGAPDKPSAPHEPSEPAPATPTHDPKNLFWLPTPLTVGARGVGVGIVGRF
jgi:hypothetical protein